jgi:LPXTG-site transpeptidase (sortase) family protein
MNIHHVKHLNIFLITFFIFTLFFYVFLNGGAFWRDLRYALFLSSPFASEDIKNGELLQVAQAANSSLPGGQYQLIIPKIAVVTPIVEPRSESKQAILGSLEEGVGLYPGSVTPGESGRAILLGHSSRASWYRGEYATVFTTIGRLEPMDEIYVTANQKKYVYQVFAVKVLSPTDTNALLTPPSIYTELDLVTCYPIGGASHRTVVQARLIRTENL